MFIFVINGLAGVRRAQRLNWPLVFHVCQYLPPSCPLPLQDTDSYTDAEHLQPWLSSSLAFLLLYPCSGGNWGQTGSTWHPGLLCSFGQAFPKPCSLPPVTVISHFLKNYCTTSRLFSSHELLLRDDSHLFCYQTGTSSMHTWNLHYISKTNYHPLFFSFDMKQVTLSNETHVDQSCDLL